MNRRRLLSGVGSSICGVIAGCGGRAIWQPEPKSNLHISGVKVLPTDSGWTLTLLTSVEPYREKIPNVTLVAYTEQGALACERTVGTVESGNAEYQLDCAAFPAIISAETGMDCEEVTIDIVYWTGTDEQRQMPPTEISEDEVLWEVTTRACGEPIPPGRLLTTVQPTEETTESQSK